MELKFPKSLKESYSLEELSSVLDEIDRENLEAGRRLEQGLVSTEEFSKTCFELVDARACVGIYLGYLNKQAREGRAVYSREELSELDRKLGIVFSSLQISMRKNNLSYNPFSSEVVKEIKRERDSLN